MQKKILCFLICFATITFYSFSDCKAKATLVKNIAEFNAAVAIANPGDIITLANGNWENVELLFEGKGTLEKPISLMAEDKGKVILCGLSNIRIAGEYLVVSGLVFKNGFTPTGEVISFKKDNKSQAFHCRVTECVIDNYSNPERLEQDYWIAIYGRNNRVDHNHIEGKRNLGVTVAVRLELESSDENNHQIDHNYFGPRPSLGSNGGETLRIGTSRNSLKNSRTVVEYNYFDRCRGELEIISNKSCKNSYRYNTFYECFGTLTLRHGSGTLVEANVFIGNNKPNTGGIRVINGQQTIINNYGIDLKGYRFRGALVIMNGVPNSAINRYHQVKDAVIKNNVLVNCDYIQLCAGSDKERSATPINSLAESNIFYHDSKNDLFTIYDDISGIKFNKNFTSPNVETGIPTGFKKSKMKLVKDKMGFLIPQSKDIKTPFTINPNIATKENTGTTWYSKKDKDIPLNSGNTIQIDAGMNTLFNAVKQSKPGDIIELSSTGDYFSTKLIEIKHPLTIKSSSTKRPTLYFEKNALFSIENGGSLSLEGIIFDGKEAPDYIGNAVIRTSKYSMNHNYKLLVNNCDFVNLDVNHSYDVLQVYKNTFADTISITNSKFTKISGNIMLLDKETDEAGIYNAEYVILKNNSFSNIGGVVASLLRGGTDESTFGPFLEIDHCVFNNVGNSKRNKLGSTITNTGVQYSQIQNNIFSNSKGIKMHLIVGNPIANTINNNFYNTPDLIITGDQNYTVKNSMLFDPAFENEINFGLKENSVLKGKATDGLDLGVIIKN